MCSIFYIIKQYKCTHQPRWRGHLNPAGDYRSSYLFRICLLFYCRTKTTLIVVSWRDHVGSGDNSRRANLCPAWSHAGMSSPLNDKLSALNVNNAEEKTTKYVKVSRLSSCTRHLIISVGMTSSLTPVTKCRHLTMTACLNPAPLEMSNEGRRTPSPAWTTGSWPAAGSWWKHT